MIRVQFDEAVAGCSGGGSVSILVLCIGDFKLRLLGKATVRIARLKLFVILDGLRPVAIFGCVARLAVELIGRPSDGLIVVEAATRHGERQDAGGDPLQPACARARRARFALPHRGTCLKFALVRGL